MDPGHASDDEYYVQYNAKDAIQYALAIGLGRQTDTYRKDLKYVFEDHPEFSVFPTFAFTLIFWAKRSANGIGNTSTIPKFPPSIMEEMGIIPKQCIVESDVDVHSYPLLHTSQSIEWSKDLPIPTKKIENGVVVIMIKGKFISVHPKLFGTFVTTEYIIFEKVNARLATIGTIRFTTLILGLPIEMVQPYKNYNRTSSISDISRVRTMKLNEKKRLLLDVDYHVAPNAALLYRLASGDMNHMHVDPDAVPEISGIPVGRNSADKIETLPFIHGLCTLGIAVRTILQHFRIHYSDGLSTVRFLECQFKKPVFINDIVTIRAWEISRITGAINEECGNSIITILFIVVRKSSSESILVDNGRMDVSMMQQMNKEVAPSILRSHL